MAKKMVLGLFALLMILSMTSLGLAGSSVPKDEKKHTTLGKYATAEEAYEMWKTNPDKIFIVDVRTPEEYSFIGHAAAAYNIPSKLWTGRFNAERKEYGLDDNPDFEAQVKKKFSPNDTLLLMCRSGQRSAHAVNRLAAVGFTNVYNIVDGFEGDKVSDDESYFKGKRMLNGWRNSSASWTYDLDPERIF